MSPQSNSNSRNNFLLPPSTGETVVMLPLPQTVGPTGRNESDIGRNNQRPLTLSSMFLFNGQMNRRKNFGVRRALVELGRNDRKNNEKLAEKLLTISAEEFKIKWDFDPIKMKPITTKSASSVRDSGNDSGKNGAVPPRYEWTKIATKEGTNSALEALCALPSSSLFSYPKTTVKSLDKTINESDLMNNLESKSLKQTKEDVSNTAIDRTTEENIFSRVHKTLLDPKESSKSNTSEDDKSALNDDKTTIGASVSAQNHDVSSSGTKTSSTGTETTSKPLDSGNANSSTGTETTSTKLSASILSTVQSASIKTCRIIKPGDNSTNTRQTKITDFACHRKRRFDDKNHQSPTPAAKKMKRSTIS